MPVPFISGKPIAEILWYSLRVLFASLIYYYSYHLMKSSCTINRFFSYDEIIIGLI